MRKVNDYIAVIQAGGKGTRMREMTKGIIPKPMLLLNGKPMLEWQIEKIAKYGIYEFVIILGYLGNQIKKYFGDGSRFNVHIRYIEEKEPLGSAGALILLKSMIQTSNFLLVFGDVMFDIDWSRMMHFHENHGGDATLLVHPNAHPYDSDLLVMDNEALITGMHSKHNKRDDWYDNCVNAGIYILSSNILEDMQEVKKTDLEQDILLPLIKEGKVYGYHTPEYVKDAGTIERFHKVLKEQMDGIWDKKNLEKMQKCVFLDRDGTVNRYKGFISKEDEFELEDGAAGAVRRLNEAGWLVIVVTNQPVVARGMCEMEDVKRIHKKMQVLLGNQGAYLDDIAFCPHHPDKGYPEENPIYKVKCGCRKPETGMIDEMVEKYNIDISQSFIVGDSTVDIQTGRNAGMYTILVSTGLAGRDGKYCVEPDKVVKDLTEAVDFILSIS